MKKIFLITILVCFGHIVHGQEENIQKLQIVKD